MTLNSSDIVPSMMLNSTRARTYCLASLFAGQLALFRTMCKNIEIMLSRSLVNGTEKCLTSDINNNLLIW